MSKTQGTSVPSEGEPQIVDVWSRTSPRYRRRAVLMLCLMALLFAGLCCFTFWLRTGVPLPWQNEGYWSLMAKSFRPVGSDQLTLNDFLSAPISVQRVRIHGVIMGLLFASLCSIPLLVAILYRFPVSIAFAAMVMFLASMPWLGITVLIGCALAALRPFRFSFRYASALLGLIPIAIYFVTASWEPAGSGARLIQHRALLYAPWVLAVLGSCVICGLALGIARLIGYRPGGIPPLLAMLFAVPVFLFHTHVGRDELEYRVLEHDIGPGSPSAFRTLNVGAEAARAATRRWSETRSESYDEIHSAALQEATEAALMQGEDDRATAIARCNTFMERFPKSRYVENVLYLKGRAQDQRIHRSVLLQDCRAEYRSDIPSGASRSTWEAIAEKFPTSDLTAPALYKLAILKAREGAIDPAIASLDLLLSTFDATFPTTLPIEQPEESQASVFRKAPPSTGLDVDLSTLVLQARRLREMLLACRADAPRPLSELLGPPAGETDVLVHPAQLLMWLDDTDPHYRVNLEGVARSFPASEAAAYAELRLGLLEPAVSRRIQWFAKAAGVLAGRASGAEALFRLGEARQDDSILDEAKTTFDLLVKDYPESCWAREARERLSSLSMLEATAEPGSSM